MLEHKGVYKSMNLQILRPFQSTFNWLIPRRCMACAIAMAGDSQPYCRACYQALPFQTHCCTRCGQTISAQLDYCGRCLLTPPPFDACFCPFRYEGVISEEIQRFKYGDRPELSMGLAQALNLELQAIDIAKPDLLIPVPVHISRLRKRGYNQSLLLTKSLSKLINIPFSNSLIEKHRSTEPQVNQSLRQRQNNVKGSFRMCGETPPRSIAIIDDVFTTGATAAEITKILKRNGVDYVQVWGLAHTI